ncbi:MAG TPA: sensor domain-containing diguanylate cyclase [Steroidobacteraceae bacterium]|nr:sensor domain-containing diguanylate cyclase [Steroidobacteraceae bacterium]
MQEPPVPFDENQRLRSLATLCMLDTIPEERFDRITRLACRAFNVPIALVSLVDRDRLWFKSRRGLEVGETGRSISFCGHAILQEGPFVVPDAMADARFADNPIVLGPLNIRFYAGQPVHGYDGSRVGTICLFDRQPRKFSEEDRGLLADLALIIDREFSLVDRTSIDELTSLSNRRGFTTVANHVLAFCLRNFQPATVIGIHLDNFRSVNDDHGHEAGDDVLRLFSGMLCTHFRTSDVVARLGGDEFAVLCSGTTSDQLSASLERLRVEFAASTLVEKYPGLSWKERLVDFIPGSGDTIDDLLRTFDARMDGAKSKSK